MTADSTTNSGFSHALANLLKTMIGSGLLTLPYVTAKAGLGLSVIGLSILALLTQAGIQLVVRCVVHERQLAGTTYVDIEGSSRTSGMHGSQSWYLVSNAAFGRVGWYITCASLMTAQLGVVSSYVVFVGNNFMAYLGLSALESRLLLWLLCSSMCMLRTLRNVAVLSMAALCVYAYIIFLVGMYGAQALPARDEPLEWFTPSKFGSWFGPSLFAFEGMGTALSIYESMGAADAKPFYAVVSTAYAYSIVVYSTVAAWGYICWGSSVSPIVIRSFPATHLGDGAKLMLAIVLLLTYPLQASPIFQLIDSTIASRCPALTNAWPLFRMSVVALTCVASYVISDMESMVGLTGALAFSVIGFILPGAFFLQLRPPNLPAATSDANGTKPAAGSLARETALSWVLVIVGTVGGIWGVYEELVKVGSQ